MKKWSRQKWNLRIPLSYEVRLALVKKLRAKYLLLQLVHNYSRHGYSDWLFTTIHYFWISNSTMISMHFPDLPFTCYQCHHLFKCLLPSKKLIFSSHVVFPNNIYYRIFIYYFFDSYYKFVNCKRLFLYFYIDSAVIILSFI